MTTSRQKSDPTAGKQLLHLVFGGELSSLDGLTFADLSALDIVGIFPNYRSAYDAWKARAQATVDNARTRYFIVHLHRLLDPEAAAAVARPRPSGA
ncbi:MAG TPA: DUF4170 domain-containing protein [Bauldia sp.]|nr:DUF4170 domain-containing protein [Bauldia sp.]